jgi:hypothetical protein
VTEISVSNHAGEAAIPALAGNSGEQRIEPLYLVLLFMCCKDSWRTIRSSIAADGKLTIEIQRRANFGEFV